MPTRLPQAIASRDATGVLACLRAHVYDGVRESPSTILDAMVAFPKSPLVVGACLCALAHIDGEIIDLPTVLPIVKRLERTHVAVVRAAARLVSLHATVPPTVAQAVARWITLYPRDPDICYYGSIALLAAAGREPADVRKDHGRCGVVALDCAVIVGAVAMRRVEVYHGPTPWNDFVLDHLFPRLRA